MKSLKVPGDKTRVGCDSCKAMVSATFRYDTLCLQDGTRVPNAMLAFCDTCGAQVAMAQQSAYLVRKARHGQRKKTSVRLQQTLFDLASLLVEDAGGDPGETSAPELVLKAVLATVLDHPQRREVLVQKLVNLRSDPLLSASAAQRKLNLGLTTRLKSELSSLEKDTALTQSDLVRFSIVAAREDARVSQELKKLVILAT